MTSDGLLAWRHHRRRIFAIFFTSRSILRSIRTSGLVWANTSSDNMLFLQGILGSKIRAYSAQPTCQSRSSTDRECSLDWHFLKKRKRDISKFSRLQSSLFWRFGILVWYSSFRDATTAFKSAMFKDHKSRNYVSKLRLWGTNRSQLLWITMRSESWNLLTDVFLAHVACLEPYTQHTGRETR